MSLNADGNKLSDICRSTCLTVGTVHRLRKTPKGDIRKAASIGSDAREEYIDHEIDGEKTLWSRIRYIHVRKAGPSILRGTADIIEKEY